MPLFPSLHLISFPLSSSLCALSFPSPSTAMSFFIAYSIFHFACSFVFQRYLPYTFYRCSFSRIPSSQPFPINRPFAISSPHFPSPLLLFPLSLSHSFMLHLSTYLQIQSFSRFLSFLHHSVFLSHPLFSPSSPSSILSPCSNICKPLIFSPCLLSFFILFHILSSPAPPLCVFLVCRCVPLPSLFSTPFIRFSLPSPSLTFKVWFLLYQTLSLSHPLIYRNPNVVIPFVHIFLLTLYALSQFFPLPAPRLLSPHSELLIPYSLNPSSPSFFFFGFLPSTTTAATPTATTAIITTAKISTTIDDTTITK